MNVSLASIVRNLVVVVFAIVMVDQLVAQRILSDTTISMSMIDFSLGGHTPAGDISERFGENGFIAYFKDTEGNKVAFHSMA